MDLLLVSDKQEGLWYSPDWLDNLDQPEDEQLAVCITLASGREAQRLEDAHVIKGKITNNAIKAQIESIRREMIEKHVKSVRNMNTVDAESGERKAVTDGKSFYEACHGIAANGRNLLTDVLNKISGDKIDRDS